MKVKSKTRIQSHNGTATLVVDNQMIAPMMFTPLSEDIPKDYLKRLGDAGIEVFFLVCDLPWLKQPGLDTAGLECRLHQLREAVPDAKIILRVNLHPPLLWMEDHPDELVHFEDGSFLRTDFLSCYYRHKNMPVYSLVSREWRNAAGKELKKLIDMIREMPGG